MPVVKSATGKIGNICRTCNTAAMTKLPIEWWEQHLQHDSNGSACHRVSIMRACNRMSEAAFAARWQRQNPQRGVSGRTCNGVSVAELAKVRQWQNFKCSGVLVGELTCSSNTRNWVAMTELATCNRHPLRYMVFMTELVREGVSGQLASGSQ